MGVWERDYMHGKKGGSGATFGLTPAQFIWWLIGINLAVYLLPSLTGWGFEETPTGGHRSGGYSTRALLRGEIWTLLTYQFVHHDMLHLALNMAGLYFLGRHVVHALGAIPFLGLYLAGGVTGALFETLARAACIQQHTSILGASAAVSAVVAMFVALTPHAQLQIFPFPFQIRARTLLWGFLAINGVFGLLSLVSSNGPATAYLAHCGGALYGLAHARYFRQGFSGFHFPRRKPKPPAVRYATRPQNTKIIDAEFTEVTDGDYNAVLDKINREGIASLTARERRILEQASEKLSRQKH